MLQVAFSYANRHLTPHTLKEGPHDLANRVSVDPKRINGTGQMNRTQLRCIAEFKFIS